MGEALAATTPQEKQDKKAGMILPDASSFVPVKPTADSGPGFGTVIGLDLTQWAYAIVDLADKPDRIDQQRHRMRQKGYQPVQGDVSVVGWRSPEVWVIPRVLFEQRKKDQANLMRQNVANGRLADSALRRPRVILAGKDGIEIPLG